MIVIVDFFPLTIHTDETRHCSGQKWLYGTLHHLLYLERKLRKILITMVHRKLSANEVIGILLQIWMMVTGHIIIDTKRVYFGNFHTGRICFYDTILM